MAEWRTPGGCIIGPDFGLGLATLKRCNMATPTTEQITRLLAGWCRGDRAALDELTPLVYDELHRIAHRYMRREKPGHTLQTSALINETYLRLIDQREARWQNRAHFFAIAARMMRRILVDQARRKAYAKRGDNPLRVSLDEGMAVAGCRQTDLVALDDALKDLETLDERRSRVVDMKFFGGLTLDEIAQALEISVPTVEREWRAAKAWLHRAMTSGQEAGS
jgi:RNA polymerase sigma-70 factor, ECF subfamily